MTSLISQAPFAALYSPLTAACFAGLWQGAALALMAAALLRLMPRASAGFRHSLLMAVFLVAVILPWVNFGGGSKGLADGHVLRVGPWFAAGVAFAWMAASCVRGAGLFLAWRQLRAIREQAIPIALEGVDNFEAGARRALLCVSSRVDSPTIIGFVHPRMLLPAWMVPLIAQDDLRQIALHECEHLRRYDDWLNLLLQVGLVLSPLNPALVWLDRRIDMQRELACDAAVVEATSRPIAYATCLTRLAEQRRQHTRLALALAAWGRESELGTRVQALLAQSAAWTRGQSCLATCATAAVLFAGAAGLARAPQLIRVGAAPAGSVGNTFGRSDTAQRDSVSFDGRMPVGVRAVPASFQVKRPNSLTPAKPVPRKSLPQRSRTPAPSQRWSHAYRMLPPGPAEAYSPLRRTAQSHSVDDRTAVRFVTTDFTAPYVAVPVADGWLVFQL